MSVCATVDSLDAVYEEEGNGAEVEYSVNINNQNINKIKLQNIKK